MARSSPAHLSDTQTPRLAVAPGSLCVYNEKDWYIPFMEEFEMTIHPIRLVGTGLLFLSTFISGFWLSRSGKPFNAIILTIHKLISLAAAVLLGIVIHQIVQVAPLSTIDLVAGVLTVSFFLDAVVSGALLSIGKPMPAAISMMHRISPFLTVFSTAATLYLLLSRKW